VQPPVNTIMLAFGHTSSRLSDGLSHLGVQDMIDSLWTTHQCSCSSTM